MNKLLLLRIVLIIVFSAIFVVNVMMFLNSMT